MRRGARLAGVAAFFVLSLAAGCGKKGPPKIPEDQAPAAIENIAGLGQVDGFVIEWAAPEFDASGEELQGIGGFRVLKRLIVKEEKSDFIEIAVIPPKPVYTPADGYTYRDPQVSGGKVYEYRVVAMDAEEVESIGNKTLRVNFLGENSTIQILPGQPREGIL